MPRIVDYTATGDIRPQDRGVDAFVRAGRYQGQYYRQIAHDTAEQGVLQSDEIRQRDWPFDILALEQRASEPPSVRRSSGGGGGGGGSGSSGGGRAASDPLRQHASTSRGASALGRAASGLSSGYGGGGGSGGTGSYYDPGTGAQQKTAQQQNKDDQMIEKDRAKLQGIFDKQYSTEQDAIGKRYDALTADADKNAQNLQNYYRKYTGDPNAGIPTGIDASNGYDQYGNPNFGDFSPSAGQDTSFGGYVANKLSGWASDVGSAVGDFFTGGSSGSPSSIGAGGYDLSGSGSPSPSPDDSGVQY